MSIDLIIFEESINLFHSNFSIAFLTLLIVSESKLFAYILLFINCNNSLFLYEIIGLVYKS